MSILWCIYTMRSVNTLRLDEIIITWWRHQMETFSALLAICAGIHRSPVISPHKDQRRGALMFSLICARINSWVNNGEIGDLRRHWAHYDVIVMNFLFSKNHLHSEKKFIIAFYLHTGFQLTMNWRQCFVSSPEPINTLRPRQNGRHFADDTLKRIFVNENVSLSIKISLKFVPLGQINSIPTLVLIMAWRRPGDKPFSEPMIVSLLTHICVTRPQWVLKVIKLIDTTWDRANIKSRVDKVQVKINIKEHLLCASVCVWNVENRIKQLKIN